MRMRVEGHRQYHQKSLRTKNFETAKERAKVEHAVAFVKMTEGKSLFSPTLYKAIEMFLEHRAKDVLSGAIGEGRLTTVKTHIKWLTKYPSINAEDVDAHDLDDLIDAEMRRLKTDYVRTSMKKSIRTYTHKLLKKADRKITAVGKGKFGFGVYKKLLTVTEQ